jgi:hypothetical protein
MARVWAAYREGLHLLGHPVATVPLEQAVPRLDIAPWRFFAASAPQEVSAAQVKAYGGRKRALLEVGGEDRGDLCGLNPGFYESPYSVPEVRRRLGIADEDAAGAGSPPPAPR